MRQHKNYRPWTISDDAYLQQHNRKLTMTMMAEDLGRTKEEVESRMKVLRGLGRMSSLKMSRLHSADIEALRSEAANYLTHLVKERGFDPELALLVARKLKAHLDMPAEYIIPKLNKPVRDWVEELAA